MADRALLHRHEDAHGVVEWAETLPASRLERWVSGYTGYREDVDAPVTRLETPSGGAVLVLSFGYVISVLSNLAPVLGRPTAGRRTVLAPRPSRPLRAASTKSLP